jgi:lipopolysaccharide export system protein LptC
VAVAASRTHVRNTVILIVLAILAAATWVATWGRQDPSPQAEPTDTRPLGYYARSTRILVTDEQGRVTARVHAERLDELPDQKGVRLEGVDVEYHAPDETLWAISATSASTPKDVSLLELAGDVEIRSAPTDDSKPVTLSMEKVRFWPDTSVVESDSPVTMQVGDWQLYAIGLRTDLKGDTLELESQVHGTFAPQ